MAKRSRFLVSYFSEAQPITYAMLLSIIAAILSLLIPACGGSSSSPAAASTAPPTLRANVGITSITVSGEARAVGQAYRVTVHLHESAGTAATIVAVDLTFMNGAAVILSSHYDQPISDSSNVCPANGSVDTREFVIVDADASHAYAATAQAKVTFTDSSTAVGTATGTAGVPALSAPPPPPQTFTLTGVITDMNTHAGIVGASLNVLTGPNAGKTAVTDSTGTYVMLGLVADSFRLRASASDYDPGEQGVTVPTIPRADFVLGKSCSYTLSPSSGTVSSGPFVGTFTVTPTTANNCPWTASTPDAWIALLGPTAGTGSGSISYTTASRGSAATRTASIIVRWSSGTASFMLTEPGASCPPPITVAVPVSGGGLGEEDIGAGCYFNTDHAIDVPWIHIFGTNGGGRFLEAGVEPNSGAPRTGHITFTGDGLYLQITFMQAGTTSITGVLQDRRERAPVP
jgi:hypothetical protein